MLPVSGEDLQAQLTANALKLSYTVTSICYGFVVQLQKEKSP